VLLCLQPSLCLLASHNVHVARLCNAHQFSGIPNVHYHVQQGLAILVLHGVFFFSPHSNVSIETGGCFGARASASGDNERQDVEVLGKCLVCILLCRPSVRCMGVLFSAWRFSMVREHRTVVCDGLRVHMPSCNGWLLKAIH
jgi:hypothetical protein